MQRWPWLPNQTARWPKITWICLRSSGRSRCACSQTPSTTSPLSMTSCLYPVSTQTPIISPLLAGRVKCFYFSFGCSDASHFYSFYSFLPAAVFPSSLHLLKRYNDSSWNIPCFPGLQCLPPFGLFLQVCGHLTILTANCDWTVTIATMTHTTSALV